MLCSALYFGDMELSRLLKKIAAITLVSGALMTLSGCMGASEYAEDPLYATGYTDGCGTGTGFDPYDKSTLIRDPEGWNKSKAYRAGWKKGFNACRPTTSRNTSAYPADAVGRGNGPSGY